MRIVDGRIDGTSHPWDRAPEGATPLLDERPPLRARIGAALVRTYLGAALHLLRAKPGDVLVLRGGAVDAKRLGLFNAAIRARGLGAAIHLPANLMVHVEPPKLAREDRGYRETKTYGTDRERGNTDARGVHTGLPDANRDDALEADGLPRTLTPHPESESADG